MKIHSILHHQLSALEFSRVLKYALLDERKIYYFLCRKRHVGVKRLRSLGAVYLSLSDQFDAARKKKTEHQKKHENFNLELKRLHDTFIFMREDLPLAKYVYVK